MNVINVDKNGNIIKDLSKVVLPEEMQKQLIGIYYKEDAYENKIRNETAAVQ